MKIGIGTIYLIGFVVAPIAFILINRYARLISKTDLETDIQKDGGGMIPCLLFMWVIWPLTYLIMAIYYTWRLFKFLAFTDDPE